MRGPALRQVHLGPPAFFGAEHPYLELDGIELKRSRAGAMRHIASTD